MKLRSGKLVFVSATVLVCLGIGFSILWKRNQPRRQAIQSLTSLEQSLQSSSGTALRSQVLMPAALQSRTEMEKVEFISKVLRDEISPEGIAVLKREGVFGSLRSVFPMEGDRWAQQAGVNADACLAFSAERNGVRAEVVLLAKDGSYRVIRCNNVKQIGDPSL